jgi:Anti-sigma factor NepR
MVKQPAKPVSGASEQSPDMDRHINGMLQAMYGAVESEPIPERFLDLLEKLDAAERAQSAKQKQ